MVSYEDREWWVDYAKTIGIFLVVFIHAISYGYQNVNFITGRNILVFGNAFHMPLFFFISGYLYKNVNPTVAVKKYFKRLVIPYIFFYFVGMLVLIQQKGLYSNLSSLISSVKKYMMGMVLTDPALHMGTNGAIWFLLALFMVICLFSLLNKYLKESKYVLIGILGITLFSYLTNVFQISLAYLSINSALLGILFFYVGNISKKHDITHYFRNNYLNIGLIIVFFTITYLEFTYNGVISFRRASWQGSLLLGYLGAFSGIIMTMAISSILAKYKSRIIFLISINTLTIMGLDQPLRTYIYPFFTGLKLSYPLLSVFMVTILIMFFAVVIAIFLNKRAPFLLGNPGKLNFKVLKKMNLMLRNREKPRLGP